MRRPFLTSGLIGLGVIIISLVMMFTGPGRSDQLPDGFFTPVIAFEFANSPEDVYAVFGLPESSGHEELVQKMTAGTRLDFLFLVVYGAFLSSFALSCAKISGSRLFYLSAVVAVLALVFDILENLQLLRIMEQLAPFDPANEFTPALSFLRIFTWAKWGLLALFFISLIPFFQGRGKFGRFIALFTFVPWILGVTAFFSGSGILLELFALSITVLFVLLIIFSFTYRDMV